MKKVLFVMHTLGFGGAERSLVNLLYELPEDRYEISLLLFQKKGELLSQLPRWVQVLEPPSGLNRLYGPVKKAGKLAPVKLFGTAVSKMLRATSKARKAYRWKHFYRKCVEQLPGHYDVAVAYGGAELMYLVHDRVDADKKLIWIHNDYRTGQYSKEDDLPYLMASDEIVSISQACVDVLLETFPQCREKIHYIENITSSALIQKRAEAFVPEEYSACACNLLSIGRLWPQKGFDMAVTAAAILKKAAVQFRWYIIGEGQLREKLEKQIEDEGVQDCFILLGTRENPYPYIKNCTLMIQPSRYEGKSVVLDEAKILATPIVATAYPTVGDQIADGLEGVITPMSSQGIADGIQKLLDPQAARSIRDYLASREYGNTGELKKYIELLDK